MYFHHHNAIYDQLTDVMPHQSRLPDAGFDFRSLEVATNLRLLVRCTPKRVAGEPLRHRLQAWCLCGREIPIGRLGQHKVACGALKSWVADYHSPATELASDWPFSVRR